MGGGGSVLRDGDRVVFFGDSITQEGGYIALLRERISGAGLDAELINKGVSGNRVPDLLARVERDVLALEPDLVVVYIGINDVWHMESPRGGTGLGDYESGLCELLGLLRGRGARLVLATPSVIGEKPRGENRLDAELDAYAAVSARVAGEHGAVLCDLRSAFFAYLGAHNPGGEEMGVATTDGVHMTAEGSGVIAGALWASLGCEGCSPS